MSLGRQQSRQGWRSSQPALQHQLLDGAIIAAAGALGARTLYSEDLSHDQLYGEVRVSNPFTVARPDQSS